MQTRTRLYPPADETVDVLVIGAGGAGLAAAIEAAGAGARVVLLEKKRRARWIDGMVDRLRERIANAASARSGYRRHTSSPLGGHAWLRGRSRGPRQRHAAPCSVRRDARHLPVAAGQRHSFHGTDAGAAASRAAHAQRAAEFAFVHLSPHATRAPMWCGHSRARQSDRTRARCTRRARRASRTGRRLDAAHRCARRRDSHGGRFHQQP